MKNYLSAHLSRRKIHQKNLDFKLLLQILAKKSKSLYKLIIYLNYPDLSRTFSHNVYKKNSEKIRYLPK